jgi:type II secretory ATPase GspE/PulE/Tfp pilus assembly ATPase PilB-like protein
MSNLGALGSVAPAGHSEESSLLPAELSRDFLAHHGLCPKSVADDGSLVVASTEGSLLDGADDIAFAYRRPFTIEEVPRFELEALIERLVTRSDRSVELARVDAGSDHAEGDTLAADVRDLANQPPVIRYVNLLVRDAYDAAASDIHLEATRAGLSARFRLDGVLTPAPEPPSHLHHAVVSRIKLLAELDIAERRRPQDGRIRVRLESRELDLRVSTVPTMYGESVVLRLLDHGGRPVTLDLLGMPPSVSSGMRELSGAAHGLVLVTGPTGSGKTTTLYAALARRNASIEKIITVEDPIEYQVPGVTQMPVHRQAGVSFAAALRAILRQDPDVVMIGEMRDRETAEIAVQAAMTGHLVFSTLHTNDAISAVARLVDLGIPEYLIAATLEGVLAQRLVRRICPECRTPYHPAAEHVAVVSDGAPAPATFFRGAGCRACRGTGFLGRVGVFELARVDAALRDAITAREARSSLHAHALRAGLTPLRADAWEKIVAGDTTVEEVIRVVQA